MISSALIIGATVRGGAVIADPNAVKQVRQHRQSIDHQPDQSALTSHVLHS